jgi:hypothetical protein
MIETDQEQQKVYERCLKRLLSEYVRHDRDDLTHLGLRKQTPASRTPFAASGRTVSHPRLSEGSTITMIGRPAPDFVRRKPVCAAPVFL